MAPPMAYHLIWTCYGQWLRGDSRGYVDAEHNEPGTPYPFRDERRYTADANRMAEPPCWLTEDLRHEAQAAMTEACAFRGWRLHAINVQPDHVHVLVTAPEVRGTRARQVLKDRATRALRARDAGRRRWWTAGGKVEPVSGERRLHDLANYVNNRQPFRRVE
jgi:REP element-mobilizing transposase RayT